MPRTDKASRVITAPPERVWAALTDPEALLTWLPPGGMTGRFERFDARPGGSYRMVLTYPDASGAPGKATADSDIVEARFVDIVPGERIVQAVVFVPQNPAYAGSLIMTPVVGAAHDATAHSPLAGGGPDDVCDDDPSYPVGVTVTAALRRMTEVWRGDLSWPAALRSGAVDLQGTEPLRRALPGWFRLSIFASAPRPAAAAVMALLRMAMPECPYA